jgi:hypothetical protein
MAGKNIQVTPKGIAVFPKIIGKPDEYQGKKFWATKLRLSPEAAKPIEDLVTATIKEYRDNIAKDPNLSPADKKKKLAWSDALPVTNEVDRDGNETGFKLVSFKTNFEFQDPKTQQMKQIVVAIFDAKGNPCRPHSVWGGTEMKVSYYPHPYDSGASKSIGVSLRLMGVQILKLVSGNAPGSSSGLGFQAEEGYEATADAAPADTDAPAADAGTPGAPIPPGLY